MGAHSNLSNALAVLSFGASRILESQLIEQPKNAAIAETNTRIAQDKKKQDDLLAEKKDQDKRYQDELNRSAVIADQDARRRSAGGRSSTILTSPLGVTESYTGTKKTLLGQ